jgi:uncharacterized protein involved in type VI secretion and phage assembly
MPGPLKGKIVDTNDPHGLGRVRVTFPSLGEGATAWAPVLRTFGPGEPGQPGVGDLVLVVFEDHDLDAPIVLGRLTSAIDNSPSPEVRVE